MSTQDAQASMDNTSSTEDEPKMESSTSQKVANGNLVHMTRKPQESQDSINVESQPLEEAEAEESVAALPDASDSEDATPSNGASADDTGSPDTMISADTMSYTGATASEEAGSSVDAAASADATGSPNALISADAMSSTGATASEEAGSSVDASASAGATGSPDAMSSTGTTVSKEAGSSVDASADATASKEAGTLTDATVSEYASTSVDAMVGSDATASNAATPTEALQSNSNTTLNTEDQGSSDEAPIAPLRSHNRNGTRAQHDSVLSCPDVINIISEELGESNRRHSMDFFDARNRVKKKKGAYKPSDISGPICGTGDGPSSTMKTRAIRTANSDSNLLENVNVSRLTVNMTEYTLNEPNQRPLIISWDITSSISSLDCISLYLRREDNVPELVSFRNAGVGYMPKGEISWDLNQHQEKFTSEENFVIFKYYHPTSTGGLSLVAASEQVVVYNKSRSASVHSPSGESMRSVIPTPLTVNEDLTVLVLSDLCGYNLKRGVFFNPDPYVKISVFPGPRCSKQPHHKQMYRTKQAGNTINPVWKEQFIIKVLPTDLVELEVKDRFDRSRPILRRFLGRLLIPIHKLQEVIGQGDERFTEALGKRSPIDQTSGSLSFLVTTTRRNFSPNFNLGNVPSSRDSVRSVATSEESSDTQMSMEDETCSSDTSEQPDVTAPEYVMPSRKHELPNGSASMIQNDEAGEVAMEMEVSPQQSETQASENVEATLLSQGQDDAQMSSTNEPTESERTQSHETSNVSDTVDGAVAKNTILKAVIETSPSPIPSPKERSPMRKNRLGAISFFPDESASAPPSQVTSFSKRRVPSLIDMSLQLISKQTENKDKAESTSQNKRTVPSLMRLTSLELQQKYGAVGGATNIDKFYPAPDEPQAGSEPPKPGTSFKKINETNLATPPEVPPKKKRTSLSENSPSNEVLSITIHRTKKRNLGLSIVGGWNRANATGKHIRVKSVELGSPASEAGVKVDDRILAVNSQSMMNVSHEDAVSVIRDSGDEVIIQVERKLNAATKRKYSSKTLPRASGNQAPSAKPKAPPVVTTFTKGVIPPKVSVSSGSVKLPSAFDARFRASKHRIMSTTDVTPDNEIPSQEGLPQNWQAFKDRHGRVYYVDHENRTTQWNHPTNSPTPSGEPARGGAFSLEVSAPIPIPGAATIRRRNSTEGDKNYESAMKRYQSIKRAMKRQSRIIGEEEEAESSRTSDDSTEQHIIHSAAGDEDDDTTSPVLVPTVEADSATSQDTVDSRVETDDQAIPDNSLLSPGCKFLSHPGFRDLLVQNAEAHSLYQSSSALKYLVTKVSRQPTNFQQYQHNKELVKFVNMFAKSTQDLPRGWDTRNDSSGKPFFIDHNLKLTTFIDPRLPLIEIPTRESPPPAEPSSARTDVDESRGPVQSPIISDQPPPVPPRPQQTITEQSGFVEQQSAQSSVEDSTSQDAPTAYNEKVVAFLQQPNIIDILKERHPEVGTSNSLAERIMIIRTEGVTALERLSYSVNLTLMLSKFEEEIMNFVPKSANQSAMRPKGPPKPNTSQGSPVPTTNEITKAITRSRAPAPYRRDFESKLHTFYRKLDSKGYGKGPNKIKMQVRRDHLLEDAFQKVKSLTRKELQRSKLNISFAGEEGLDYSGPSREFFFLVSRELFNPYYGLFEYSAVDTYTVQISPMSAYIDDPMDWFRFAGRIIGLALIHHYLLDAFFTRPLYKALLRAKCDISDLQYIDEQFYNSLMWMKDNDITDVLDLTFTADEEVFGQVVERELKPHGKNIAVTEKNKKDYIERIVKWRVNRSCREQTNQIVRGFNEVIDLRLVSMFDAKELELVLCGTAEIDLKDWRLNTEYRGGYHDLHPVIQWFWEALEKFDNERRLRLLQFVTGTSSIPYEGFTALRGPNGPKKFCIEKWGKVHFLPRAHTCFNRVDLPPYPSFQVLWEKLTIAVEETSTFGIE